MGSIKTEESELLNSSKYRQYVSAVDKALKSFEYTTEWADLIAALGKLNKVLLSNKKFGANIPKPVTVAKRLAQCLHPALPSGVHLKALETYKHVFSLLGKDELPKLLHLFAVGLFPLLSYAGIKVKNELLNLYEEFLLPLSSRLKPACVGFLTGLLSGLEEGSEFFDKTNGLLEELLYAVGAQYFYTCLWQCIRCSPSVRLPALVFVTSHFDRGKAMDDQLHILGSSIDDMVGALCSAGTDASTLVQRHLLDFLCFVFPLNSEHLVRADQIRLIQSSLFVVLRRDMSLNRRLYSWLLGTSSISPSDEGSLDLTFFTETALPLINDAISGLLVPAESTDDNSIAIRIARLYLYILDKAEIGTKILEGSLFGLLVHVEEKESVFVKAASDSGKWKRHRVVSSDRTTDEFPKNLNLLLNCLDPGFIWTYCGLQLGTPDSKWSGVSVCRVIRYLLGVVQLDSHTDIRSRRLPILLRSLLQYGESRLKNYGSIGKETFAQELTEVLSVSCELLREIQQASGAIELKDPERSAPDGEDSNENLVDYLPKFDENTSVGHSDKNFSTRLVGTDGQKVVEGCLEAFLSLLEKLVELFLNETSCGASETILNRRDVFNAAFTLLKEFSDYPLCALLDLNSDLDSKEGLLLPGWIEALSRVCLGQWKVSQLNDFHVESACLEVLLYMIMVSYSVAEQCDVLKERLLAEETKGSETFHPVFLRPVLPTHCLKLMERRELYKSLANRLWGKLGADCSQDNDKAAALFSSLHTCQLYAASYSDAEIVCLKDITSSVESERCEAAEKFNRFWSLCRNSTEELGPGIGQKPFSRVVLVLLSSLTSSRPGQDLLADTAWRWLEDCLQHGDAAKLLQILCLILLQPNSSRISIQYVHRSRETGRNNGMVCRNLQCLRAGGSVKLYHLADSSIPCGDLNAECAPWMLDIRKQLLTERETRSPSPNMGGSRYPQPLRRQWALSFDEDFEEAKPKKERKYQKENLTVVVHDLVNEIVDRVCEQVEFNEPIMNALERSSLGSEAEEGLSETDIVEFSRTGVLDKAESGIGSPTTLDVRFFEGVGEQKGVELRPGESGPEVSDLFHPLHAHFLIYTEGGHTELGKPELVFSCLASLLKNSDVGKILAGCLASHATSALRNSESTKLCGWMGRHVKTILGHDFWKLSEQSDRETAGAQKNYMFLELFLTISLYYLRSYHLNDPVAPVGVAHLEANWRCKIACLDFLDSLARKLNELVAQQGQSFATYLGDVLMKSKFQKCLLHCMMASTHEIVNTHSSNVTPLSVDVARFNCGTQTSKPLLAGYQRALLSLVSQVTELEFRLKHSKGGYGAEHKLSVVQQMSPLHSSLTTNSPLVELRLFLLTVLNALKRKMEMHEIWLKFIVRSLPYFQRSLPSLVVHLSEQLSKNLQLVTEQCYNGDRLAEERLEFPTNYMYILLEAMTAVFGHCLSENVQGASSSQLATNAPHHGSSQALSSGIVGATKNATGEIFTNLVRVLTFSEGPTVDATATIDKSTSFTSLARTELLGALPHILSTLCDVWSALKKNKEPLVPVGLPQHVRRLILDLLSPISVNHPSHFLSSIALVWLTKGSKTANKNSPNYSTAQLDIADLLLSIKMFPFDSLLSAACQTLKDPVRVKNINEKDVFPIEVSLLEIVHGCLLSSPVALLRNSWSSVQKILMDVQSLTIQPPARFLTFHILSDFVRKCCTGSVEDRSSLRGMQDVCIRITESLNSVIAWQLEQPTWLKRTLVVKSDASTDSTAGSIKIVPTNGFVVQLTESLNSVGSLSSGRTSSVSSESPSRMGDHAVISNQTKENAYSSQALWIIADSLSSVIDMICKSEDKERLLPTLHAVWANVHPYLKTRNEKNARNFLAASKFLAGLSQFSYSRPVWKKGTLDLVTEIGFFRMDVESLRYWLTIVDNLMTQDKTSFKDLLTKISVSQGPSLFTSRDQEYEMRAACLKRLAFVLLSSEVDQYQAHMPEIQERLTDNLRLVQVPHVHAQVFLCLRVILIRLSPQYLTSIWPVLVTELVQVLQQIEQDLTETQHINNDYRCNRDEQWFQLYLSVCKLLDALCTLPSWHLSQFQLFQWAFTSTVENDNKRDILFFVPHVARINERMKRRYGTPGPSELDGAPLLSQIRSISKLKDLRFFFHEFSNPKFVSKKGSGSQNPVMDTSGNRKSDSALHNSVEKLESSLYVDFLENWR